MSIFITADTHGGIDEKKIYRKNFPEYKNCTKEDYLIVLGDWGYIHKYNPSNIETDDSFKDVDNKHTRELLITERNRLNAAFTNRKFTTLVIFGNHENYDRIKNFPTIQMFGGNVRKINDSVFELMRGEVYNIDGYKVFVFGGARSIDKFSGCLQEGIDWWKEEESTYAEEYQALENLKKYNNKVDLILTHTCSKSTLDQLSEMFNLYIEDYDSQNRFLEEVKNTVDFSLFCFGHMHKDLRINEKEIAIFNRVVQLDKILNNDK